MQGVTYSEEPTPVYSSLRKTCPGGFLKVPSVGAGTANTEFEILTGMTLDYFGAGEYPYKTVLQDETCESMAYNLRELGYRTGVLHNNTGSFYSRNKVFANLGKPTKQTTDNKANQTWALIILFHRNIWKICPTIRSDGQRIRF